MSGTLTVKELIKELLEFDMNDCDHSKEWSQGVAKYTQ